MTGVSSMRPIFCVYSSSVHSSLLVEAELETSRTWSPEADAIMLCLLLLDGVRRVVEKLE